MSLIVRGCFGLVVCFSAILQTGFAADALQPLKYNHEGLVVDLGVGLWAFPLPIDYDGDGDMDLLVGCPDKPSNGVYFFENPTQDPSIRFPTFRPAVRVGGARQFMMLSQRGDRPSVLVPGKAYDWDAETKSIDFTKPRAIQFPAHPDRKRIGRTRANMWRYVDFDGDGDHDLSIGIGDWSDLGWDHAYDHRGVWRNGPLHGYVYIAINDGDDENPRYRQPAFRLQAAGSDIDVYGWPGQNFADFDGDGDLDLLCGEFLDGFTYFENIGTRQQPEYAVGRRLRDAQGQPLQMHVQMITPTAVDWDGDGDVDLIVGDEDGRVALVEHTGRYRDGLPVFAPPRFFQQQADTLKFGALATPTPYDWDDDGDQDLLCGNTAGEIAWFENLGKTDSGAIRWSAPQLLEQIDSDGAQKPFRVLAGPNGSIQGPCEAKWGYTTLTVADWDGDGDGDIVYNSIEGRLGLLINEGGRLRPQAFDTGLRELPPKWIWHQRPSAETLTQWRTTPVLVDFDGDQKLDLVMLDQEGYLTLRRDCRQAERIFVDPAGNAVRLNAGSCGRSGRVKLAVVDWDQDGRLDVLVNSENATWYRNAATRDGKVVLKRVGNLAKRNISGHTSSPAATDLTGDGKPDLLVGSENGRIYFADHDDCVTFSVAEQSLPDPIKPETPRFPGLIEEEFIYDDAPFPQCHASTICETSRGLVAAWFGGTREKAKDVGIWVSYHDGLRWSRPQEVANGVQHDGLRHPCWNPVLFQPPGDAPTLLFFKVGPDPQSWWGEMMVSYDRGRSFRDRRRLPETIDGPVRCKPVLLPDGNRLLCGSSTEYDGWRVHFEVATLEDGQPTRTWQRVGPINDASKFNAIQPTFVEHQDGSLRVLCRTREGMVATSHSTDGGRSWSKLVATDLPNPNSGIDAVTLNDGRHLLVYNPLGTGKTDWGKRSQLSLAVSDDGLHWKRIADLERTRDAEFSYPAIIQAGDGRVHVTYTWKRQRIKHVVIDPQKLPTETRGEEADGGT